MIASRFRTPASSMRRGLGTGTLAAITLVAAAFGALLGIVTADDGAEQPAAAGPRVQVAQVAVELPEGWQQVASGPAIPGLTGADTAVLRGTPVDIVVAQRPLETASLLPLALQDAAGGAPVAAPVTIAGRQGRLYAAVPNLLPYSRVDMYVLPTTTGVATLACVSDATVSYSPAQCETVAEQLRLVDAVAFDAVPGIAAGLRLPAIMGDLDRSRVPARRSLAAARTPAARSAAALRVSGAYSAAAGALLPLVETEADGELQEALTAAGTDYASLAEAARRRRAGQTRRLGRKIIADEQRLVAALEARPVPAY